MNFFLSIALHASVIIVLIWSHLHRPNFEGYPVVVPVSLVEIEPVSYKAPEVEKLQPRKTEIKPQPKKLEGVTMEQPEIVEEPEERQPKQEEPPEEANEGKSAVGGEKVKLDVAEFPFSYYLAVLQSRIQTNWEPPASPRTRQNKKTTVYFKIQRSGRVTDIAIESASGDYLFDQAALRAVTLANPLPPLPYDFPQPALGVHFDFEQGD